MASASALDSAATVIRADTAGTAGHNSGEASEFGGSARPLPWPDMPSHDGESSVHALVFDTKREW
jgi:hypothetical protein